MIKLIDLLEDQTIYEGLIYSISSEEFQDHIERWAISKHKIKIKIVSNKKIQLTIMEHLEERELKNLFILINNLGWYVSVSSIFGQLNAKWEKFNIEKFLELYKDNNKNVVFQIEPKFHNGKPIIDFMYDFYHVSPTKHEKKILKIGLVPKSKEKILAHPERVYFTTKMIDAVALADTFSDIDKEHLYTIFKANLKSAKENNNAIRVFIDPNFSGGVFTLSNIPPQFLKIVKRISV